MTSRFFTKFRIGPILIVVVGIAAGAVLVLRPNRLFEPRIDSVLLISIDTLRADYLSSYGFGRDTTPHIDAVAREGVLFKHVVSPVPQTLPAHSSMLTGTIPPVHGLHDNLGYRLGDANVTLAEMLKDNGFTTGAIVSSFVLDKKFNLSQGFDTYNDRFEEEHKIFYLSERKGDEASRFATRWLEEHRDERFFLFLHYYDPHDGYDPPEPFASRFADDPYAGEVAFTDHCVGEVMDKLKDLGLYDTTLIVITSDHGEMLGEHGELTHQYFIYQSALEVPLIFKVPGLTQPREVEGLVGLIDIVPTIAGLLGIDVSAPIQGKDLSPWLKEKSPPAEPRHFYAETNVPTRYYDAASLVGLVTDDWKYIQTTRPELYDLRNDPGETANLVETEGGTAAALKERLEQILKDQSREEEPAGRVDLDEDSLRRLEALGYLGRGGESETRGSELAGLTEGDKEDPKDLIEFYRSHQRLAELTDQENYDEAEVLCERLLRERPDFLAGHLQMARIATAQADMNRAKDSYLKALELEPENANLHVDLANVLESGGELEEAISHYRRAIDLDSSHAKAKTNLAGALLQKGRLDEAAGNLRELLVANPDNPETIAQLGLVLQSQGKPGEAVELYRRALVLDPESAQMHLFLGNALASQENLDEAIDHFQQALRADPELAEAHDQLGLALRERGKAEEALRHFREAVRLKPQMAGAHNNLGQTLKQLGRPDEALQHYRRALSIDPDLAAAHNNLGSLLGSQGRLQEAMSHFRRALESNPDFDEALNNLGLALRMTAGDRDEALAHFRAALKQRPDWVVPMNEIAWIVATHPDERVRDPKEAVRLAQRAAELTGHQQPTILDTLAAAYASSGDFESAVATAEKAVALASAARAKDLADEMAGRLELYRNGKPFREAARIRAAPRR